MTDHIGETVVVVGHPEPRFNGYHGVVRGVDALGQSYAVEFPFESLQDFVYLHDCRGACAEGRGYFISKEFLRLASDPLKVATIGEFLSAVRNRAEAIV